MNKFIEFVSNNYIWFIIASIILLFALIGFLSERNKKRKGLSVSNDKPVEVKEEVLPVTKDEKDKKISLNEAINKNTKKEEKLEVYDTPLIEEDKESVKEFKA